MIDYTSTNVGVVNCHALAPPLNLNKKCGGEGRGVGWFHCKSHLKSWVHHITGYSLMMNGSCSDNVVSLDSCTWIPHTYTLLLLSLLLLTPDAMLNARLAQEDKRNGEKENWNRLKQQNK